LLPTAMFMMKVISYMAMFMMRVIS
jgi:hypothetical protein